MRACWRYENTQPLAMKAWCRVTLLWVGTHCTLSIPTTHTHHIRRLTAQGKLGIFHTVLPQCRNKSSTLQSARGQRGRTRKSQTESTPRACRKLQPWAPVKTLEQKGNCKVGNFDESKSDSHVGGRGRRAGATGASGSSLSLSPPHPCTLSDLCNRCVHD